MMIVRAVLLCCLAVATATAAEVKVRITGLEPPLDSAVRESLSLVQQQSSPYLSEYLIRRLHQQASEEIAQTLQAYGYYKPAVQSRLDMVDDTWEATYHINLNLPVRISVVDVRVEGPGAEDPALIEWRKKFPLDRNEILLHSSYESAKQALLALTQERGYVEAKLDRHEVEVDPDAGTAQIHLHLTTGPRYRFGRLVFRQEGFMFDEKLLARYIPFSEGDPYDADKLFMLQRSLLGADYFSRADIRAMTEQARDRAIPVEVQLAARERTRYTLGLGYGTDTGPRGRVGEERRWINARGHQLATELSLSGIKTEARAQYRIPRARAATDFLIFTPRWVDEETDTSSRVTRSLSAAITQQFDGWLGTLGLDYELETFRVGEDTGRSALLIPRVAAQRSKADSRLHPRRGWSTLIEVRGAGQSLLSDTTFVQARLSGKIIQAVSRTGRIIVRMDGGASWVADFSELPASYRFFAGGDNSVRGYAYNSLGPLDTAGEVAGGKNLLVGSIEYDHSLGEKVGAALFYDAGNAFDDVEFDPQRGAGLGLRWRLPVGAIRLDVARGLDKPDRPWRLHLTAGVDL